MGPSDFVVSHRVSQRAPIPTLRYFPRVSRQVKGSLDAEIGLPPALTGVNLSLAPRRENKRRGASVVCASAPIWRAVCTPIPIGTS